MAAELFLLKCPPHRVDVGSVLDRRFIRRLFTECPEVKGYIADADAWWEKVAS